MKNAITVVDQELIDWFDSWFACDDELLVFEQLSIDLKTKNLLQMAKDLIEINAELTKREQKYKNILRKFRDNPEHISSSLMCDVMTEIDGMKLKGDSDE